MKNFSKPHKRRCIKIFNDVVRPQIDIINRYIMQKLDSPIVLYKCKRLLSTN